MIKTYKIKIENNTYKFKTLTYRAMFKFEEITGKKIYELTTFHDEVALFYSILKTSNKDFEYNLEGFIDLLEEDDGTIWENLQALVPREKK